MLKKILVFFGFLYVFVAFAAVDANRATAAELDSIKGIGPGLSGKILDERAKSPFKDWNDLISRVNGVGAASAAKYSVQGLTVNGSAFSGAAASPATPKKRSDAPKSAPAGPSAGKAAGTSAPMAEPSAARK